MTCKNIIVKDYIFDGNYIFGTFYEIKDGETNYILDDGDIYSEKTLKDSEYEYILIPSTDIIDAFKDRFEVKPHE